MSAARPEATNATRVAIAAAIPTPASSIQAGKNAPKSMKEGAPLEAHPLIGAVSNTPSATLVNLMFAKGYRVAGCWSAPLRLRVCGSASMSCATSIEQP